MSLPKLARAALAVALLPFATCTDFTGPSGRGVRVPVIPTFSAAANFAKALYSSAGIEFDRVRILIVRDESEVLKDTTFAFSPSSAELTLPLVITANPGEPVTATLEYRTADIVLYSGTSTVITLAMGQAPGDLTPILLVPVGPGAAAETVELSPASGTFPSTAPVTFTATAFTTDHSPIANAIFGWTADDATVATVNAQGVVQPTSKGGPVKVRATTLNGKFAEATITFATSPATIALKSGGDQSILALDLLPAPVVVKVLDGNGAGVPGVTVNFAVATGGGSIAVINGVSDASGLASVNWTLGESIGTQSITATAVPLPDAPITINATATERPAVTLAFGQLPLASLMGAAITPAVTVKALDDKGHVVAGYTGAITIALDVNPSSATLGGLLTVNAVAGIATFSNLSLNNAGIGYSLKASATGFTPITSEPFDVDQVPQGLSLNAGGNQTKVIRSALDQIVVKVADANGDGVAGVNVDFDVVAGGGSIVVDNSVTDASGFARATWTLGSVVGAQTIKATSVGLAELAVQAEALALPAVKLVFGQQPTSALVSAALNPAVTVAAVDGEGNIVADFTGDIAITLANAAGATLGGTTSVTAVAGVATFPDLSVNLTGLGFKLVANSGLLTTAISDAFSVTPRPPFGLVFKVQPSNVVFGTTIAPGVQVRIVDVNGATSTAANDEITISLEPNPSGAVLSGTLKVNAVNGVAIFNDLSIDRASTASMLRASAGSLQPAVSLAFDVTLPLAVDRIWTGAISTDWNVAGNWNPLGVPSNQDSVTVVSTALQPVITTAAAAEAILVEAGATLKVNAPLAAFVNTFRIHNKGTLQLTSANLFAAIDNQATVVADSFAFVSALSNVGTASKIRVVSTQAGVGVLSVGGTLNNEGAIELDDSDQGTAEIVVADSLVNKVGASISVNAGLGGQRAIQAVLRNHGSISVASPSGLVLFHFGKDASVNDGSISFTGGGSFFTYFGDTTQVFDNTGTIALGSANWQTNSGKFVLRGGSYSGKGTFQTLGSALDIDFSKFTLPMAIDPLSRFPGDSLDVPTGQIVRLIGGQIAQKATIRGTLRILNPNFELTTFSGGANIYSGGVLHATRDAFIDKGLGIASGGTLKIEASGASVKLDVGSSFQNSGLIEMSSSGGTFTSVLTVGGTGTIVNAFAKGGGGTINILGGPGERWINATIDNRSVINVASDAALFLKRGGVTHLNSGTITLADAPFPGRIPTLANTMSLALQPEGSPSVLNNSGTINVGEFRTLYIEDGSSLTTSGLVAGNGAVQVQPKSGFTNTGVFAPGGVGKVGTMIFRGNFNVGTGSVDVDIASMTNGDLLSVSGVAAVGGKIRVNVLPEFKFDLSIPNVKVVTAAQCVGIPSIEPVNIWGGYNDGCVHVYPVILFGPQKPPT